METCADPDLVVPGRNEELLAAKSYSVTGKTRFLVVIYMETSKDGFIITAILRSDVADLRRRGVLWPRQ